jgi:hypothetical protein
LPYCLLMFEKEIILREQLRHGASFSVAGGTLDCWRFARDTPSTPAKSRERPFSKVFHPPTDHLCTPNIQQKEGEQTFILLGGGTKQRQQNDIKLALERWDDYKQRKKQQKETKEEWTWLWREILEKQFRHAWNATLLSEEAS